MGKACGIDDVGPEEEEEEEKVRNAEGVEEEEEEDENESEESVKAEEDSEYEGGYEFSGSSRSVLSIDSDSSCGIIEEIVECNIPVTIKDDDDDGAPALSLDATAIGCDVEIVDTPLLDQASFFSLSEDAIYNRQVSICSEVASNLGVSRSVAGILLRNFQFNLNHLLDQWARDEKGVRCKTGLFLDHWPPLSAPPALPLSPPPPPPHHQGGQSQDSSTFSSYQFSPETDRQCRSCCNVSMPGSLRKLKCGHSFCSMCWATYVRVAMTTDGSDSKALATLCMRCPLPFCDTAVSECDMIAGTRTKEDRMAYRHLVVNRYIQGAAPNVKRCPGNNCRHLVEFVSLGTAGTAEVTCGGCRYRFCWTCLNEAHRPVRCDAVLKWKNLLKLNGEKRRKEALNLKHSLAEKQNYCFEGKLRKKWKRLRINFWKGRFGGTMCLNADRGKKDKGTATNFPARAGAFSCCRCSFFSKGEEDDGGDNLKNNNFRSRHRSRNRNNNTTSSLIGKQDHRVGSKMNGISLSYRAIEEEEEEEDRWRTRNERIEFVCGEAMAITANKQQGLQGVDAQSADCFRTFSERWAEQEWRQAGVLCDLRTFIAQDIDILSRDKEVPLSYLDFVRHAIVLVVECRRVLKWSCVQGCIASDRNGDGDGIGNGDHGEKNGFLVYLQCEAEFKLNRLHRCAARELRRLLNYGESTTETNCSFSEFQNRLRELSDSVRDYFRNLVLELENGFQDQVAHFEC